MSTHVPTLTTGQRAPAAPAAEARIRWLPSPTVILLAVLAVLLVCISIAKGLSDPDYYWHLTTGRLIATTGHIPSTDPYSFTWAGKPWTLHEWLSELLLYWLVTAIGATGAMIIFGLVASAAFAILAIPLRREGVRTISIGLACILGAWVVVAFITVRPQVLSFLLLGGLIALLMSLRPERAVLSLLLIPYFVLWANLHGLWVVGLGAVGLYLLFTLAGRTPMAASWRWMVAATLGAGLAVMSTPAGPATILYPLRYVQPGNWGLAHIEEWQSPNFHDAANWGFLVLVLALILNGGRGSPGWLVALSFVGALLGLVSVRNEPIAAVFAVPVLAMGIDTRIAERRRLRGGNPGPSPVRIQRARRVMELIAAAVVAAATAAIILPASPLGIVHSPTSPFPAQAVDRLLAIQPSARVVAEYGWGGYVISRVYAAGGRVFVDGRNDMYSEQILNDYSSIRDAADGWSSLADRYGVEAMLFPPDAPITRGPAQDAGWCPAYRDQRAVLLLRDCTLAGQ